MTSGVLPWVETESQVSGSSRKGCPECPYCSELSSLGTGCSTSARTRFAMKRAVRTTDPFLVTSLTSTTPRRTAVSTLRPALLATTS